ncbi:MAG: hypothetical protein R6V19_15380, partial [Armatimonadota bacterium]
MVRGHSRVAAFLTIVTTLLFSLVALSVCPAATIRASVATDGSQGGDKSSGPAISADGRYVAFESRASFVAADTNGRQDIYRHDVVTGETICVSLAAGGGAADLESHAPAISADGQYVAFDSPASNLVAGDTNGVSDIFVHNCIAGETTRITMAPDGSEANGHSFGPAISDDGRFVAFSSSADNLVAEDNNAQDDVFVHDLSTGETELVSVSSDGVQGNSWIVGYCDISADGRYVAFGSWSDNLVENDTNDADDVFVRDRQAGTTARVSVSSTGSEGADGGDYPSISDDGQFVSFESSSNNLVPGDTNGQVDVFLHDCSTGTTTRVSVGSGGVQGNAYSFFPSISGDGRYIVFASGADNLVSGDTNGKDDIFVFDRVTGSTVRVSLTNGGDQANGSCYMSAISLHGQSIAFDSKATNLVSNDTNGYRDVFVRQGLDPDHRVTITAGPSGDPNPVGSGGDVQCTVSAECSDGHALSYHWSAEDPTGNPAGSFDNATAQNPTWTAPTNDTQSSA